MRRPLRFPALAAVLALVACGGAEEDPAPDTSAEEAAEAPSMVATPATVEFVSPVEGAELEGPDVVVEVRASGVEIVPAGEVQDGTGHHHFFLDADVSAAGVPIPSVPGEVIHLGDGSATYTFEGVEPGEHRLITVVADGVHVPLDPWVVDTVTFTVR